MTLDMPAGRKRRVGHAETVTARAALPRHLSRQLNRFDTGARAAIRSIVRKVPQAGDLIEVFPGVLHALATGYGSDESRSRALALIESGGQLKRVARQLGLPTWLRRLPPEAFRGPLGKVPDGDSFSRRIAQRIPLRPAETARWLDAICFAERAAGQEFALWVSRQRTVCFDDRPDRRLAILSAYAWFSTHPETEAGRLIWSRWRPEISLETGVCAAKSWFNRLILSVRLPPGAIKDAWLDQGTAGAYTIVPLLDSPSLIEEASFMNNCADQYAVPIAANRCRLFSVQLDGKHVATLEMAPHQRERRALAIAQLKGRHNMPAPLEVWQAVYLWLSHQHRLVQSPVQLAREPLGADTGVWQRLMAPYRTACDGAPWLPPDLALEKIEQLDAGIAGLAHACEIRSWLFV